jgi:outer membrane protein OmpA-like peptidoglycan-associated protein
MRSRALLCALALLGAIASLPAAAEGMWISYRDFWFDFDSVVIDKSDSSKIADVASYMKQNPSIRVGLDGERDSNDSVLGERRIRVVRAALMRAGVPASSIVIGDFGDPRLRRERRVEVLFNRRDR